MKHIYTEYVSYNLWANERMTSVFKDLPEEIAGKNIVSSFPSAKLTVLHIWDAEFLWLKRLHGVSPTDFPSKGFTGSMQDAIVTTLKTSADFLEFVNARDEVFFEKTLQFTTLSYGAQSEKAHRMVHHCMNHSTYHRGQLTMMARQLGITKVPPTDFIYYFREQ